ncbi:hypothetical protein AURDEDRAFT_170996 [Auricularia subglabra TFB-10046 SS5]|nr:hypothetical protein AURDEDRAFT_170996 [Auricularia subglabra TFB-10046 SS5]
MVPARRILWEILPLTLVYLGSPELLRLGRTCSYLQALVAYKMPRLYDVDAFLGQLFFHSAEFRFLQACTGLLVSGSQALQFLDRVRFGSADVDLYVGAHAAYVVINWLLHRGFILLSSMSPFRQGGLTFRIPDMITFARIPGSSYFLRRGNYLYQFISPCGTRKIDLIVTARSAFSAICDFHSTAVMNFISAYYAISMFPYATFDKKLTMVVRAGRDTRMQNVLAKYASRGWTTPEKPEEFLHFGAGPRLIRDSGACWVLPLAPVPSGPFQFWDTRSYDLSMFHSAKFRQGSPYWHSVGLSFFRSGDSARVTYTEIGDTDLHAYCLPKEVARCWLIRRAITCPVAREDPDLIDVVVDEAVTSHMYFVNHC